MSGVNCSGEAWSAVCYVMHCAALGLLLVPFSSVRKSLGGDIGQSVQLRAWQPLVYSLLFGLPACIGLTITLMYAKRKSF